LASFSFFGLVASFYLWIISLGAPSTPLIYLGILMLWGAYGLLTVAIYTTSMDHVRPGREGTDFTLQIVITHLSSLIISVISGKIADTVSYSGLFLIETLLGTGTFLALFFLYRKKKSAPVVQK
jgi:predicted MFS family arabinose efflux permease